VLVVDDNRDAAETLAVVLRVLGHDVTVAADGREALAVAADRPDWDAFILDIGMPDMTGHELAVHLRQRIGERPACFIALTGYGQAGDRALTRKAGFDHHLVKPASIADIQALLVLA
jgi:CheY-like chemotaxis protein